MFYRSILNPECALRLPLEQKKVCGSIVGGRADMLEMLDLCALKGIKPLCEVVPLAKINDAIDRVLANKARFRYRTVAYRTHVYYTVHTTVTGCCTAACSLTMLDMYYTVCTAVNGCFTLAMLNLYYTDWELYLLF